MSTLLNQFIWLLIAICCAYQIYGYPKREICPVDCACINDTAKMKVKCSLSRNQSTLPEFNNNNIELMDLSHNHLDRFPREYANQINLYYMDLSYNDIAYLQKNSLAGFHSLRVLNLSYNRFKHWLQLNPNHLLTYTNSNLQRLILNGNKLHQFHFDDEQRRNEMLHSEYLEELSLDNCDINYVGGNVLAIGLPKLKQLNLSHNAITNIQPLHSSSLESLRLMNCSLRELHKDFFEVLPNLEDLDMGWNPNLKLDAQHFVSAAKLKNLGLSFCNLEEINLEHLPQLITLQLEGNRLHSLKEMTFTQNNDLQMLDLSQNSIRYLDPTVFRLLPKLHSLNLAYNELARLDSEQFRFNRHLKILNLARNAIEDVSTIRSNSLQKIDLSWCDILHFDPDFFEHLPNVAQINLSNNLLNDFPEMLTSLNLQDLDLSNCRLTAIHNKTFRYFPKLQNLKLNGNRFTTTFMAEFFENNDIKELWLGDNPWICGCESNSFEKFYNYLNVLPKKIQDPENVVCASPDKHFGKTWNEICGRGKKSKFNGVLWWTIVFSFFCTTGVSIVFFWIFSEIKRYYQEKRAERELELNEEEMRTIRRVNERILSLPGALNAPSVQLQNSVPPSYEDALRMPKPIRTTKSLVDLASKSNVRIPGNCTTESFNEEQEQGEEGLRYRSEEILSDRDKERSFYIAPARRLDHINPQREMNCRHLSIADHRYPSSNLRAQNLQSAEQIANFQNRENSPYSKRRKCSKVGVENDTTSICPNKTLCNQANYAEMGLYEAEVKTESTFMHCNPQVRDDSTIGSRISTQGITLPQLVENTELTSNTFQQNRYQITEAPNADCARKDVFALKNSDTKNAFIFHQQSQ